MTRSPRALLFASVAFVLAAGGYGLAISDGGVVRLRPAGADRITVSGNIEAHQSVLSITQVQAPIVELPFDEGAVVARDTVLARVDDRLYRQQVDIDHANQQVAAAQVATCWLAWSMSTCWRYSRSSTRASTVSRATTAPSSKGSSTMGACTWVMLRTLWCA